jgi:hypothetical protein
VPADGACPTCGTAVDPGGARVAEPPRASAARPRSWPWHVKALAGVLALYLGYRAYQGIEWLARQL